MDLSTSAKLAVKWIILKCYYVVNLILDSIWIILVFYCKFSALKLFFFTLHIFNFFYLKINKSNRHNNTIDISSFQNGLDNLFSTTGFYFKSKILEGSHKGKICFSIFGHFFSKCTLLKLWLFFFFLPSGYPMNVILQGQYIFIRFMPKVWHKK